MHVPVLTKEVLQYLDPKPNENFVDATIGQGGHAVEILKNSAPFGKLLGIDLDKNQIRNSRESLVEYKERVILINSSYANIEKIVGETRFGPINGILLDLGFSTWHLDQSGKGFSFQKDEHLDMRYNSDGDLKAEKIINEWPERELEKILREFGEEKFSSKIARKITNQRRIKKIESTFELRNIVEGAVPAGSKKYHAYRQAGKIHPATRTFQALRIAVNRELDNLKEFLPQAIGVLSERGRLAVISFHSLEDRIVKHFFREKEKEGIVKILTKKPITALDEEILANSASRSAKLRAIIKS